MTGLADRDVAFHAARAPTYDRDVTSEYDVYDRLALLPLLAAAGVGRRPAKVLDLGCGTGAVSLPAARMGATVTGLDHSLAMLDVAREKAAREGLAERATFAVADITALPFADASFDVVTSQRVLHHIPEADRVLREARRVLAPGGCLLLSDSVTDATVARRVLRRAWLVARRRWFAPAQPDVRDELPPLEEVHRSVADLRRMLAAAGFTTEELRVFTHVGLDDLLPRRVRARLIAALSFPASRRRRGDVLFALARRTGA